jgi:hypothetical protein
LSETTRELAQTKTARGGKDVFSSGVEVEMLDAPGTRINSAESRGKKEMYRAELVVEITEADWSSLMIQISSGETGI